jgi:hypothetical protein
VQKGSAMTASDHQVIREVQRRLRAQQGELEPRQPVHVLDQVVGTVLSQHTSDVNSGRAFARLKARFPAWEQAAHAPAGEIEDAIRCGGLARRSCGSKRAGQRQRPSPRGQRALKTGTTSPPWPRAGSHRQPIVVTGDLRACRRELGVFGCQLFSFR